MTPDNTTVMDVTEQERELVMAFRNRFFVGVEYGDRGDLYDANGNKLDYVSRANLLTGETWTIRNGVRGVSRDISPPRRGYPPF